MKIVNTFTPISLIGVIGLIDSIRIVVTIATDIFINTT